MIDYCTNCDTFNTTPYSVSSLYIYINIFAVSQAFIAGAASQAGDTDSSLAKYLEVHDWPLRVSIVYATVMVHQFFLFYILFYQWKILNFEVNMYLLVQKTWTAVIQMVAMMYICLHIILRRVTATAAVCVHTIVILVTRRSTRVGIYHSFTI